MLLNYLKLGFRLLLRNPFFTLINILGLSVGIAIFYFLWQYAQFELSSDQFHQDYQRIVRVGQISPRGDLGKQIGGTCHLEVSRRIKNDFDEIEDLTRIINQENFKWGGIPFHDGDIIMSTQSSDAERISFRETKVAYVDPNIFTFFTLPLLQGSAKNALAKPFSVVISERTARKYFGHVDPVGRTMTINDSLHLIVTGIFKNLPHNTHLDFEILISTTTIGNSIFSMAPKNMFAHCYLKLKEGVNGKGLEDKLSRSSSKYATELEGQTSGPEVQIIFLLQPLDEVAFSFFRDDYFIPKSKITITFFVIASLIILGMAWINYLNLTLAFNHRRMKEFAARKTLGAKSIDLIIQFITESLVVNTIAITFAFTLIQLTRRILETEFAIYIPDLENDPYASIGIIILLIVSGILFTGLYPALLTKAKTPKALLGSIHTPLQKNNIGMWLTTTQYTSAITLIIWAFVFMQQLNFMLHKDLGIDTENVIAIDLPVETDYHSSNLAGFTHELTQNKDVLDFAVSRSVAGDDPVRDAWLKRNDSTYWGGGYTNGGVDERFLPFYKIKLLAGRNFLPDHPADEHHILVDMNALRVFGITNPQEAIGQDLWLQDQWPNNLWYPVKIIGVIETFSLRPLSQRIFVGSTDKESNVLTYKHLRIGDAPRKMSVRVNADNLKRAMSSINQSFKKSFPDKAFNWYFLDQHIYRHYNADKYARNQIFLMTGLAIGIACLGLLGMMVNQVSIKTKELGIRKVLGAEVFQLGLVLLKSTIFQVTLAVFIALPVAHLLVSKHLSYFMERIALHWSHYAIPVLILAFVFLSTIAYTLIRAIRTNPAESLRYE